MWTVFHIPSLVYACVCWGIFEMISRAWYASNCFSAIYFYTQLYSFALRVLAEPATHSILAQCTAHYSTP